MDGSKLHKHPAEDLESLLPAIGTVINVCGGDEGISKTFRDMLHQKLLWTKEEYCPIGKPQRLLPSPLFSDTEGLRTMRVISRLPTYYMTDCEVELFEARGHEVASFVPSKAILVDLGCGDIRKVKPLLDCLEHRKMDVWYFALDLSREELERGMHLLTPHYQHVKCYGLWGTFDDGLAWLNSQPLDNPRFFMSLGAIFGNDHFNEAVARLSTWKNHALRGKTDVMLLTMDATTDTEAIWQCYHDPDGLFEQFIRNGYRHSNRILNHDWYRDEDWEFLGVMQEEPLMHRFVIRAIRDVACPPLNLELPAGTEIDCYEGFKYSPDFMRRQFAESGFHEVACWKAPRAQIYQYLLVPSDAQKALPVADSRFGWQG
ncbi:putative methyltransferase domain-containing protein [Cladophialophora immunda]|nr:putative methyltransferase domain-containing protein [Cladophialophora immunda]